MPAGWGCSPSSTWPGAGLDLSHAAASPTVPHSSAKEASRLCPSSPAPCLLRSGTLSGQSGGQSPACQPVSTAQTPGPEQVLPCWVLRSLPLQHMGAVHKLGSGPRTELWEDPHLPMACADPGGQRPQVGGGAGFMLHLPSQLGGEGPLWLCPACAVHHSGLGVQRKVLPVTGQGPCLALAFLSPLVN